MPAFYKAFWAIYKASVVGVVVFKIDGLGRWDVIKRAESGSVMD